MNQEWRNSCRWSCENPVLLFKKKAKDSLAELKLWSKYEFEGRKKNLDQLLHHLQSIKESQEKYVNGNEVKKIEKQIDAMLLEEEIYWRQRSRAVWLQEGDKNTTFFHSKASARKRKNTIEGLINEHNN